MRARTQFERDRQFLEEAREVIALSCLDELSVFADMAASKGAMHTDESLFSIDDMVKHEEDDFQYPVLALPPIQSFRLWKKRFGNEYLFDEYLAAVPPIPEYLKPANARFPELVLVDACYSMQVTCELASVNWTRYWANYSPNVPGESLSGARGLLLDVQPFSPEAQYWMRCNDGWRNRGKSSDAVISSFASDERGMRMHEGIALIVQKLEVIRDFVLVLPGSRTVSTGWPPHECYGSCLRWHGTELELGEVGFSYRHDTYGSGTRLK